MSNALTRLSEAINGMGRAARTDNPDSRSRLFAQYREESAYWLRVLEEQEVESTIIYLTYHDRQS